MSALGLIDSRTGAAPGPYWVGLAQASRPEDMRLEDGRNRFTLWITRGKDSGFTRWFVTHVTASHGCHGRPEKSQCHGLSE